MKIVYTRSNGAVALIPKGDEIASLAALVYGHCLNQDHRRGVPHTGPQFAEAIGECYDLSEPRNAAVVAHLQTL